MTINKCKAKKRQTRICDRITRNSPAILIFHAIKAAEEHTYNLIIYAPYAMLTAHSLELGTSLNGIAPAGINKLKKIKEIFQVTEENEAIISVIVGYPKYKYKRAVKRENTNINWIE